MKKKANFDKEAVKNVINKKKTRNRVHKVLIWEKVRTFGVVIVLIIQLIQLLHILGFIGHL